MKTQAGEMNSLKITLLLNVDVSLLESNYVQKPGP